VTSDEADVAPVANQLADLLERVLGAPMPVRIRAWDGSEAGSRDPDAPVAVIGSSRALRRLLWQPGELGFARAYVTGDLDVDGDLDEGFRRVWQFARQRDGSVHVSPGDRLRAAALAVRLGAVGLPPRAPASEARVNGGLHTKRRDRAVIAHHYDLSNDFYEMILDEHMAYSCAYFTSPNASLREAQRAKLELICHKLDIQPRARLLDVGCGWGSLSLFAAEHRDAKVTGVTLSQQQLEFVEKRVADRGLHDQVDARLQDYRDINDGPYDVAASIEMGEHVGAANYPRFVEGLHRQLRPGGRLLVQQMSRGSGSPGGGPFIEAYIAPDMHMRPVHETVALLEDGGFDVLDVEDLREHYAATAWAWNDNFTRHYDEIVELAGEEVARVWRLYIVGGALAFEEGRMGVEQILATARPE
jgi:cyclopropane-fatty-acyl-phospholipid synthase